MTFAGFLNSIVLLGALQGFVVGLSLHYSSRVRLAGKLLAWLLLIMALACLKIYLNNIGLTSTRVGMIVDACVPFMIIMPVGPLIYLYCKAELSATFKIEREDRIHFYPVIIDLFHHLCAIAFMIAIFAGWANPTKNDFGYWFDLYNVYSDIPRWISLTVYLLLSFRLLYRNASEQKLMGEPSLTTLSWLKEFLWVFLVFDFVWLTFTVPYVIPRLTDSILNWLNWYPLYLPVAAIIYWLGIRGFLLGREENRLFKKEGVKLDLTDESIQQIIEGLQKSMVIDKLYLDAELNLSKLASHIGAPPKTISAVVNQHFEKSFNEFVNQYRIEEIKYRLVKTENRKYTIAALAYDCGFNSQPTFQRAFKTIVGSTPSEYLQRHKEPV